MAICLALNHLTKNPRGHFYEKRTEENGDGREGVTNSAFFKKASFFFPTTQIGPFYFAFSLDKLGNLRRAILRPEERWRKKSRSVPFNVLPQCNRKGGTDGVVSTG